MKFTLNCEGTGNGSIRYQWQTKGVNENSWRNIGSSNKRSLAVENLQQSRQYRCVVSNEAGRTRSDVATIEVLSKVLISNNIYLTFCYVTGITSQPAGRTVIALEDVTLTCSASVDGVRYTWHRVDGSLPSRATGQRTRRLIISNIIPPDKGMYYCVVSKMGISVESNRAVVNVDGKLLHNILYYTSYTVHVQWKINVDG